MANIGKKTEHKIPAVLPQINKGAAAPLSADLNTFKPATKNEIAHSLAQPTSSLNSHQIKALEKPKDVESYKQEVETSFVSELGKANILKAVPWFAVGMGLFYKAVPKIAYALEANTKSTGIFEDPVAKIPQIANIPHKILANKITQNKGAVDGIETFSSFANVFMNSFNYRNNKAKTRGFASLFHKFSKILTIPRSLLNSSLMLTVGLPNLLSFGAFQLKEKDKALALKSLAKPFENLVGLSKSLNDLDRLNHGKGSTLNATAGLYFNSCLAHKDFDKTIRELNQKDENGESIVSQNLRVLGVSEHIIQTVDKNISKIINLFVKETDNDNESSHFDTELGTMKPKAVIREVLTYASQLLDRHDRYISDRTDGLL